MQALPALLVAAALAVPEVEAAALRRAAVTVLPALLVAVVPVVPEVEEAQARREAGGAAGAACGRGAGGA